MIFLNILAIVKLKKEKKNSTLKVHIMHCSTSEISWGQPTTAELNGKREYKGDGTDRVGAQPERSKDTMYWT